MKIKKETIKLNAKTHIWYENIWVWIAFHIITITAFSILALAVKLPFPKISGPAMYAAILVGMNLTLAKNHWQGRAMFKKKDYGKAVQHFERSYDYFVERRWIEPFLTLIPYWYSERNIFFIALCLGYTNDRKRAKSIHAKLSTSLPESDSAKKSLKLIAATENSDASK